MTLGFEWPWRPAARFAAVLSPGGLDLVCYENDRGGVSVLRSAHDPSPLPGIGEATERLADRIEAEGGRGARLALVVRGFGSAHHLFQLPDAKDDVLRSVVKREFRRLHADIEDPVVDFIRLGPDDPSAGPERRLLAAAIPRAVVEALHAALSARKIVLDHLTVGSAALLRVYYAFEDGRDNDVALLVLPGAPVVTGFTQGWLRFSHEPPIRVGSVIDPTAIDELVKRAFFSLRRDSHGSTADGRLLVSAEPEDRARLEGHLTIRSEQGFEPLGPPDARPGTLAALGAALDASDRTGLDLLPPSHRSPTEAQGRARLLASATAALLTAAVLAWSWSGVWAADRAADRLEPIVERIEEREPVLARLAATVRERAAQEQRGRFLEGTSGLHVGEILDAIAEATPPTVRLDTLRVEHATGGRGTWRVALWGVARGASEAEALFGIQRLHDELPMLLPLDGITLGSLDSSGSSTSSGDAATVDFALDFSLTFRNP